jgi:hypothetical protein
MRIAAFFFALSFIFVSISPQGSPIHMLSRQPEPANSAESAGGSQTLSDGVQMLRRADIVVVPIELTVANQAELASLHDRVVRSEMDMAKLDISDPAARAQLSRQRFLMRALLNYAERQGRDEGKSRTALQVQQRLNTIEGRVMCEACHSGGAKTNGIGE